MTRFRADAAPQGPLDCSVVLTVKSVDVSHADGRPAHATMVAVVSCQPFGSGHGPGESKCAVCFSVHATTLEFEQSTTAVTANAALPALSPASTDTWFGSASARF